MSEDTVFQERSASGEVLREWSVSQADIVWLKSVSRRDRAAYEEFHDAFLLGEPVKGLLPPLEAISALRWARLRYGNDWTDDYLSYVSG